MPINFSVCCNISFVTRNGVGDGDGEGSGIAVGDGVCAHVLVGRCGATIIAVPSAGTSFTNERRSIGFAGTLGRTLGSDLDLLSFLLMASRWLIRSLTAGLLPRLLTAHSSLTHSLSTRRHGTSIFQL